MNMEQKFRLDRTVFRATTAVEANDHIEYWKDKSYTERLEAAYYLIVKAFGIKEDTRLDRSAFSKRKANG